MDLKPIAMTIATIIVVLVVLSMIKITSKGQKKSILDLITSK